MLERRRHGACLKVSASHLAGEVVIPLREIEDMAGEAVDVKRYILSRRTTKEKVLQPSNAHVQHGLAFQGHTTS